MYLESVALLPQLYMFQKQATDEGGIVEVCPHHPLDLPFFDSPSSRISRATWCSPWASLVCLNLLFG
jgi:hypothetical protein